MPSSDTTRRVGRALRLMAAEPLPPVPDAASLVSEGARRPGELHEALPLDDDTATWLARVAAACGVTIDVLGSILLEAALVAHDIGPARFALLEPGTAPHRRLTAAEADYLRVLTIARRRRAPRPQRTVAVPLRIAGRLHEVDPAAALHVVAPERALSWECVAVGEGRTLTECVLLRAARGRA